MRASNSQIGRFLADQRGSLTIEFVIWVPWLLFYLMFTTAAFLAMDSRLEATRASITLTDVVSREEDPITETFLTDLAAMMDQLTPSVANGKMYRISVLRAQDGAVNVKWSTCFGGIEALTEENLPADILPPMTELSEVLLVETFVPYQPISRVFGIEPVVWTNRKFVVPRFVQQVVLDPSVTADCGRISVG